MSHHHVPHFWESACTCGAAVYPDSFRDRSSYEEFDISGLCQACQDGVFLGVTDDDPPVQYALRRGAVAATTERDGALELGVLPFLFTAPDRPPVWEARYATHVAHARGAPIDPYTELEPMRDVLLYHQVRLTTPHAFDSPILNNYFGQCELLVGLDTPSLDRVGALCPALSHAAQAPMAVPFERRHGAVIASLGAVVVSLRLDSPNPAPSALRLCAWMGALLAGASPDAPALFAEVLGQRADVLSQCPPWRQAVWGSPPAWVSDRPQWRGYVS